MKLVCTGILKKIVEADEGKIKKSPLPMDRMADAFKTRNSPVRLSHIAAKKPLNDVHFFFVAFQRIA